jgi:hypothetical protein
MKGFLMAYRYGDRQQRTLFPQSVDEYIRADAPVRAYDVIVDSLDFDVSGIEVNSDIRCVGLHFKRVHM